MAQIEIAIPQRFDLAKAVFSYGWALLSPNQWRQEGVQQRESGLPCFIRPLHVSSGSIVTAEIYQPSELCLHLAFNQEVPGEEDKEDLTLQVRRMLRLASEDEEAIQDFHKVHAEAREENFGRLLRSPTVWEDLVKWGRTVSMNKALCQKIGAGAFPRAADVATADPQTLQNEAGLGYRAKNIIKLAQQITAGEVDLESLEDPSLTDKDLLKKLIELPGIGPFSAANMLQLLGRYEKVACDSETVRHFRDHHKMSNCTSANVQATAEKLYDKYAPFQFLAYWHELWHSYELLAGPFRELDPEKYGSFTGRNMTQHLKGPPRKRKKQR